MTNTPQRDTPDLFNAAQWPFLLLPADDTDLQDCVRTIMRTEAGQKFLNMLMMKFLMEDAEPGLSDARQLGRQDVAKWVHRQYNLALYTRAARPHIQGTG